MVWAPKTPEEQASQTSASSGNELNVQRTSLALFPYLLVIVVFAVAKLWTVGVNIPKALTSTDIKFPWPGLDGHLVDSTGKPLTATVFNFNWLSNPGTLLFLSGLITVIVYMLNTEGGKYPMSFKLGFGELFGGAYRMRLAALTIAAVMGLAYVMNFSGQTGAIGAFLAGSGSFFPIHFADPWVGWYCSDWFCNFRQRTVLQDAGHRCHFSGGGTRSHGGRKYHWCCDRQDAVSADLDHRERCGPDGKRRSQDYEEHHWLLHRLDIVRLCAGVPAVHPDSRVDGCVLEQVKSSGG